MIIQKQLTGDVWLVENGENIKTLSAQCTFSLSYKKAGIDVIDLQGRQFFIPLVRVQATQILPAAEAKFTGDLSDLWDLLVASFFQELHITSSGGGGVVETNIISVGANYNVLLTDYIIVATANCTLSLPQILTNIGVVFRIFSNGFNVRVDAFAGDTINSETMQNLSGFEMFTLRSLLSNKWLIGD
jgi:hypothetical protein